MAIKKRNEIDVVDTWDLENIFETPQAWEEALNEVPKLVDDVLTYKGRIMESNKTLYEFYKAYDKMNILSDKVYLYAKMQCDTDTTNAEYKARKAKAEKLFEDISTQLSYCTPEILSVDYELVLKYISENKDLEAFKFDLEKIFRYKEHTLSEQEEELISNACNALGTGSEVFYNFDNADMKLGKIIDENGDEVEVTNSNYIKLMNSRKREVRISAFSAMYEYFKSFKNTISAAYIGQIKEDFFLSKVRKYNNPLEKSLYNDDISIDVYNNLIASIHKSLPSMYRYMDLRKRVLGLDQMHMYDIYVDIIDDEVKNIPFDEGKKLVFGALKPLGSQYIEDLNKAFDERWIDKYPNIGKKSGAYSWGSYGTYPYLLLNYDNTTDSVSTMAHELGHSMHSYYSNKCQNSFNCNYPIFLAEIASTVNEVLVDDYFYKNAKNDEEKILYLSSFLDKVRTTIFRQTMFAEFEKIIHEKYQENVPITVNLLCDTYYDLNKLYFGKNIVVDDAIKYEWARIPHFYTSFYVYKYATGLIAALSIASDIINNENDMKSKYMEFLKSGASDYPLNILRKTGVDITDKKTIKKAFTMFEEKLKLLEELVDKKV